MLKLSTSLLMVLFINLGINVNEVSAREKLLLSQATNVEHICKDFKIRISNEGTGQKRLRVDIKKFPTNIFWNSFDVTLNDRGSIVRTRNLALAGDNASNAHILGTFNYYYSLYRYNKCWF